VGRFELQQPLTNEGAADRFTQQLPMPAAVSTFRDQLLLARSNPWASLVRSPSEQG